MVARVLMLLCLLVALGFAGNAFWQTHLAEQFRQQSDASSVRATGLVSSGPKRLAAGFTDSTGMLLADAPTDPAKLVDPSAMVVGHLEQKDSDADPDIAWPEFDKHLSEALGRPVTDIVVDNGPSQIDKIKTGQITVMALHAADAPFLVNNCGYHPVAVLGTDSGAAGNRLDLIVPADSKLAHPSDLKGRTLTCTGPLSIVGYRAAIALLLQNEGLRPNVDYLISWSLGQNESIAGIAQGTYEAAAVSDDKLRKCLAKGTVKITTGQGGASTTSKVQVTASSYHMIFQSDVFPRTTIGYFYNLKPETAAKLRDAILSYKPTAADEDDTPMHFIPVDYKKDFALIRDIDDRFDPRLEPKAKHAEPASAPVAWDGLQGGVH
jgi:phosphonate transport system substrate-binding protein